MDHRLQPLIDLDGRVAVQPCGAREIGLYPEPGLNVLWVNPAPSPVGWPNFGGGRGWISPESELFFVPESSGSVAYRVPCGVDPGDYRVIEADRRGVTLRNRFTVEFFASGIRLELELTRRVTLLECREPAGISAAGYRLESTLKALNPVPEGIHPAIWNLLQVPPGGVIMLAGADPVPYFGRNAARCSSGFCSAEVPAVGESFKVGFRPEPGSRGRMFYCSFSEERPFFVMRSFTVPEHCYDTAYPPGSGPACPQQIFCDNGRDGGFGELEYHSEPLGADRCEISDCCYTMAFSGRRGPLETFFHCGLTEDDFRSIESGLF